MEKVLLRLEFELKVHLFNNLIRLRHSIYRIFKECSITVTPCCTVCLATRKNFMLQLTFFFFSLCLSIVNFLCGILVIRQDGGCS